MFTTSVNSVSNVQPRLTIFYRITSAKAAATDPLWNPSIAGRELLKPKFYDVWLDVSGKNQPILTKPKSSNAKGEGYLGELLKGEPSTALDKDGQLVKQTAKDSASAMKQMQRLMLLQLQVRTEGTGLLGNLLCFNWNSLFVARAKLYRSV